MNNYFTNRQNAQEKSTPEPIVLNGKTIPTQQELLNKKNTENQRIKVLQRLQLEQSKITINIENEYQNVLNEILEALQQFKIDGEVRFFSSEKKHTRKLELKMKNLGYNIKMMAYPFNDHFRIDWQIKQ